MNARERFPAEVHAYSDGPVQQMPNDQYHAMCDLIDAQQATIDHLQAAVDYQLAETQKWHAAWVNAERTAEHLRAGVASPVPEAPRCTTCGGRGYFFPNGEEMVCGRCPAGEAYQNGPDGGAS